MTYQEIIESNSKLQHIADTFLGNPIFLIEERSSNDFDFQVVKLQWTKTQKTYALRVPNYFKGRKHALMLGFDTIKQAKQFVKWIFEDGSAQHYTGHVVFKNIKRY
jgi:hypothetical protein